MTEARKVTFAIPPSAPIKACRSCGEPVVWIITKTGKRMPVQATGTTRGESHFAHCAQAELWRGPR